MARQTFVPPAVGPREHVRFDVASGTDSPADVLLATAGTTVPHGELQARNDGTLPNLLGPDGVGTLYLKRVNYLGQVTGSPVTVSAGTTTAVTGQLINGGTP